MNESRFFQALNKKAEAEQEVQNIPEVPVVPVVPLQEIPVQAVTATQVGEARIQ